MLARHNTLCRGLVSLYPQHGAASANGLIRRLGFTLSWSQASYESICVLERGKMSKFKVDDVIVSPDGKTEFRVLGIHKWEDNAYYWLTRQDNCPRTYSGVTLSDYRLKPQFFGVGDTWITPHYYYEVIQVAEDPLEAWVMTTHLFDGEKRRMTYDVEAYEKLKNSITKA